MKWSHLVYFCKMEVVSKNDFHVYPLTYQIANPKKALNLDYCWSQPQKGYHLEMALTSAV